MSKELFTGLTRVTDAATEPLSTSDAKLWLKVDHSTDDTLIAALVKSARSAIEGYLRRSLISQTWAGWLDSFPEDDFIFLPNGPVSAISSVTVYATDNTSSAWSSSYYFLDSSASRLVRNYGTQWPTNIRARAAVKVQYVAGYGANATDVPGDIVTALRLCLTNLYENRGESSEFMLPSSAYPLLTPYRRVRI